MQVEAIDKLTVRERPVARYHEAIQLLIDGGVGQKIRIVEDSNCLAKRAIKTIRAHMHQRGLKIATHYFENICEIERL